MSRTPLAADLIAKLYRCAVPTLNAVMSKSGLGSNHMRHLKPVNPQAKRFVGPATTLRAIPNREDLKKRIASGQIRDLQSPAFEQVQAGEVLVIGTGGETRASIFGDVMTTFLKVRGAAGVVCDASVSDSEAISAIDLPVFAGGNAATSATLFLHFAEIDAAIGCDGVAVFPGDVLVGDGNGVVVIPQAHVQEVADAAIAREEFEVYILERINAGAMLTGTYPPNDATRAAYQEWRTRRG